MHLKSTPGLRVQYLQWVEDRVEEFKESVSRGELLALAEEVIRELRVDPEGQYQLTEMLLCNAVDRRIFRRLRLPGYRTWCAMRRENKLWISPLNGIREAVATERGDIEAAPLCEVAVAR